MKKLVHQSGKVFIINGDSESSKTTLGIISAHISNFFNKNKATTKGNPDTQIGFIIDRMIHPDPVPISRTCNCVCFG